MQSNVQSPNVTFEPPVVERPKVSSSLVDNFKKNLAEVRDFKEKTAPEPKVEPKAPEPKVESREPKPEPKPEPKAAAADEFEAPAEFTPAARTSWQKLKDSRDAKAKESTEYKTKAEAAEAKLKDLETKLAEGQATRVEKTEYERLKAERDGFETTVIQMNVEAHPKFQAHFARETAKVEAALKGAVGEQAAEVMKILALPDGEHKNAQLLDLMADMDALKQNRVALAVNRMAEIASERAGEIARSRENLTKATEQQKAQAQERQTAAKAANEKLFADTLAKFTDAKEGLPEFQVVAGDEKSAAAVKANTEAVRKLVLGQNTPAELVETAFFAVRGLRATALLKHAGDYIQKLEKQISELGSAQPRPPGGGAKEGGAVAEVKTEGMTWAAKTAGMLRGEIPMPGQGGE